MNVRRQGGDQDMVKDYIRLDLTGDGDLEEAETRSYFLLSSGSKVHSKQADRRDKYSALLKTMY